MKAGEGSARVEGPSNVPAAAVKAAAEYSEGLGAAEEVRPAQVDEEVVPTIVRGINDVDYRGAGENEFEDFIADFDWEVEKATSSWWRWLYELRLVDGHSDRRLSACASSMVRGGGRSLGGKLVTCEIACHQEEYINH
jgi:hypothetical protein